ncbi:MAG TPA: DUF4394 domain-containing protein [Longimicrobium sp.]
MRATAPLLCALLLPGGCRSATGFDVDGLRIYGVDGANNLIEFGSRSPDQVRRREITGLQPDEVLLGLDFRPGDNRLFGVGSTGRLYVVDASTTIATPLGGPFATPLAGEAFGVDFDPGSGQLRVVGSGGQNLRVDPGGAGAADAALTFAPGDPGAITTPRVTAVAFSAGSPPALYAIDSNRDALLALPTPASGVAATIGALGINISDDAAFDIVDTREGERAYAVLSEERVSRLYRIDLATGAPRLIGRLASRSAVRAMAVVPDPDERP